MAVPSMTLEDFQSSNQATTRAGGPWVAAIDQGQRSGETVSVSQEWDWCDNGFCLVSAVFPPESLSSYQTSFSANISVVMDRYGGATNLDFTWSYWPLYCGSALAAGLSFPMHVQIGSAGFDDGLVTVDYHRFFGGSYPWDPAPRINHGGATVLSRGSDGIHGYIPITISMAMTPTGNSEYLNLYIKGISFQITTPINTISLLNPVATPPTSLGTSSQVTSSSLGTSNSTTTIHAGSSASTAPSLLPLPSLTTTSQPSEVSNVPIVNNTPSNFSQDSQDAPKITAMAIGAAAGSVLFVGVIILAIILFVRKRKKVRSLEVAASQPIPYLEKEGFSQQPTSNLIASVSLSHAVSRAASRRQVTSTIPYDPPPTYGSEDTNNQSAGLRQSALIDFANANRTLITANLEERLITAGCLPDDSPDNITEGEWRNNCRVLKLESHRLGSLYTRKPLNTLDTAIATSQQGATTPGR